MNWKVLGSILAAGALAGGTAMASSHREAPFITKNPKVDGTDLYVFRSYETGRDGYVTLIADYQPFQDPFGGPNYFTLDDQALYEIHVDNNGDAKEDITFQFQFQNKLNGGNGISLDIGPAGAKRSVAVPFVNLGGVSAADESKRNVIETYTLKVVRGDRRSGVSKDVTAVAGGGKVFNKPLDYVGTKSFGDTVGSTTKYDAYAKAHIYDVNIPDCAGTSRVFVGQRKEPFAVNLGPIFDLVNAPASVITDPNARGAVPNPLGGKNISTLALEVPIACLKAGTQDVIGAWTTASVRQARVINPQATYNRPSREGGPWAQVSRLGNPLVNEVVIGIKDKDRWNSSQPSEDTQFIDYVTHPTLPAIIEVLFGPTVKAPTKFPRADLVAVFLTGVPSVNANGATAEYERLNMAIPPTAAASQNNLGALGCFINGALQLPPGNTACDPAGHPNGRRPGDDVTDIALRAVMGALLSNDTDAPARNVPFHDAVLQDASQFDVKFPYLTTPLPGAKGNGT